MDRMDVNKSDFRGGLEGSSLPYRLRLKLKIRLFLTFEQQNLEKVFRLRWTFMAKTPLSGHAPGCKLLKCKKFGVK